MPEVPSSKRTSQPGDGPQAARGPVLLVAQDRLATASLARALIRESFPVRCAVDAAELVTEMSAGDPSALVLNERTAIDMPRPLASLLRAKPNIAVVVHGCARAMLAEAMVRTLGANRVVALDRTSDADVVAALRMFFPA